MIKEPTLEEVPQEVVHYHLAPYLSYQSTRHTILASPFFRDILTAHPSKKFCFKPQTRVSHNTHQTRVIYQWADKSMLQEVRINSSPFYQHYLVDPNNNKSILCFTRISSFADLSQNQITDFGIINENLFWIVFGGAYCAVINRHSKEINTSGFFDLETMAKSTDMIAFDGAHTLYFSVKTSSSVTYLSWHVTDDTLSILHNLETINGLPVIRKGHRGYFSVLIGGDVLKTGRETLQRLIVTDRPYASTIRVSSYLSIHKGFKKEWGNFVSTLSTQYHILSNGRALLVSPFGELVLHRLHTKSNEKWSILLFTFNPPQKSLPIFTSSLINIQHFSISDDEKILAILYQTKQGYKLHIWDLENKCLLNILTVPSSTFGTNSPPYYIHFDNHDIIISDKSQHTRISFLFDRNRDDSTMSLMLNSNPN